ncbi:MAG: L-threonylcarbamoyladenylate synthase [Eubacteriales bacterium]|nr:L-threonylcarbamoyladenylate synthase [Eubacteriales bacterium]
METKVLVLEDYKRTGILSRADMDKLDEAAAVIRRGGLAAFPTETVYGLGGDALMKEASRKIYAAKGRPSDNPLIVHICDIDQLSELTVRVSEEAGKMAEKYWPGPLTMVFKKSPAVPDETTGGLDTVAVRFPVHPAALALIKKAGTVIAAPSANLSGRPSTTSAAHCVEDLNGRVDVIVDGGDCEIGLESTILDVSGDVPQLLRPGAVTLEMITETLGMDIGEDAAIKGPLKEGVKPKAPGMKYRHYAPKAPMILFTEKNGGSIAEAMAAGLRENAGKEEKMAVLCSEECISELNKLIPEIMKDVDVKSTGSREDKAGMAHVLFERLREMDADGVSFIAAEGSSEENIGKALMNRMKKAAAWQIVTV